MTKKIIKYFLQGLLYSVPLVVTIYFIWQVFIWLDGLIPFDIPGLGLLLIFGVITLIGVVGQHLISDKLKEYSNRIIAKAPLVNVVYTAIKDLLNAFVGNKKSFNKPVSVRLSETSEIQRLGFVTNENFKKMGKSNDLLTVYLPHSYNISGNLYLIPESYITPLKVNASELMKYTVSGGVTQMDEIN